MVVAADVPSPMNDGEVSLAIVALAGRKDSTH